MDFLFTEQAWDDVMSVNFEGALNVTEALLPILADGAPCCRSLTHQQRCF